MPRLSESFLRGGPNWARLGDYKDRSGIVDVLPTISPSSIPKWATFPSSGIQEVSLSKLYFLATGEAGLSNDKTVSFFRDARFVATSTPSVAEFVEPTVVESNELARDTVIWIEPRQKEDLQEDYRAPSVKKSSLVVSSSGNVVPSQSMETVKKGKRRLKRGTRVGLSLAIAAGTLTACGPQTLSHASHPGVSINQEVGQSHVNTNNIRPSTVKFGPRVPFFQTNGTHIDFADGKEYTAGGASIVDDLDQSNGLQRGYEAATDAQIEAAAEYWNVNTIRLQVSENVILAHPTHGKDYNVQAMERLKHEVDMIEHFGKIPVINDCDLFTNPKEKNPTKNTLLFWDSVTNYFANHNDNNRYDNIIFDIFNEPRDTGNAGWKVWQTGNGGPYVGEQDVVTKIRGEHNSLANNLIFVEGPNWAKTLSQLNKFPIIGSNIVFSYHHLNMNNPATWAKDSGLELHVPIIDGEWSQFGSSYRQECYRDSPETVPMYLAFLQRNHIGLIIWSLQRGVMVYYVKPILASDTLNRNFPKIASELAPATVLEKNYGCDPAAIGQGAGALVKHFFELHSSNSN